MGKDKPAIYLSEEIGNTGKIHKKDDLMSRSKFHVIKVEKPITKVTEEVSAIQEKLAIGKHLIKNDIKEAKDGLLISGYTSPEIHDYLSKGGMLLIARENGTNQTVGYLLATHPKTFLEKYKKAEVRWLSEQYKEKYEPIIVENNYVYLDQIGVLFEYHGSGAACDLLASLEKIYTGQSVISLIMVDPIHNIKSRNFFAKNGYVVICEILCNCSGKFQ